MFSVHLEHSCPNKVIIWAQNIKVKVNKRPSGARGLALAWMYLAEVIIPQKTYAVVVQHIFFRNNKTSGYHLLLICTVETISPLY